MQIPSLSQSTFDSDENEENYQYTKTPFRNKTEQLKDHSERGKEMEGDGSSIPAKRRSRSRTRARSTSRSSSRSNSRSGQSVGSNRSHSRSRSRSTSLSRSKQRQQARKKQMNSSPVGRSNPKPKTSRSEKSKSYSSKASSSSSRLKPQLSTRNFNQASFSNSSIQILPPPDLSSSSHKSIHLLVCTANLGNAPPDADSWNAWIPKNGKLVPTTKFPVRMNPPPPPPAPTKRNQGSPPKKRSLQSPGSPKRKSLQQKQQLPSNNSSNNSNNFKNQNQRKPARRGKSKDPSDTRPPNTTSRNKLKKVKDKNKSEQDSYEAYLDTLKGSTYSFDQSNDGVDDDDEEIKEKERREKTPAPPSSRKGELQQGDLEGKCATPRRSHSNRQEKDDSDPSMKGEKPKRGRPSRKHKEQRQPPEGEPRRGVRPQHQQQSPPQQQPSKGEPRRGVRRARSNNLQKSPGTPSSTPKQRKPRSKSIDLSTIEINILSPGKSPKTPKTPTRRVLRSKSSSLPSVDLQTPNSIMSPKIRKLVTRSKSISKDLSSELDPTKSPKTIETARRNRARSKSPIRAAFSRSKSPLRSVMARTRSGKSLTRNEKDRSGKGSSSHEAASSNLPPCRRISEAEIPIAEIEQIKQIEIRYPGHSYIPDNNSSIDSVSSNPKQQQLGYYDIIVIGMQEATFSTSMKESMEEELLSKRQKKALKATRSFDDATINTNDTNDNSDSDDESEGDTSDDGSLCSLPDNRDTITLDSAHETSEAPIEETKSAKMKRRMSRKKLGKSLKGEKKGGLLKKISQKASKTAKTIDTFAGGGKDHTARPLLVSPPSTSEDENFEPILLSRSETLSSVDTDDDDFSFLDESVGGKSNGRSNAKKWTDTDVIHHGLESNQLPGYTRALSYQFGQMRLLVYYKAGTAASDIVQSLDVLSVNYQATGKAGLANKGGIVAEVAVNKTTKLSFLTAHLEAHEGAKHYKARNDSLQDILMETGSNKYFDASLSSHFTFAMGDLNYRTKLADVAVGSDRHIQFSHNIAEKRDWRLLNQYDELSKSLDKKLCLTGFQTAYCNFPPTFKVDRQNGYRYNPKRSPSYTDRILFKNADQLDSATKLLLYEPVEGFTSSDHKPIRSGFLLRLNRELRWKSTAELLLAEEKLNRSIDDLDGILPDSTKGDIDADRETMHFFITHIECVINPSNYDQIRKQEKAELPNPKLLFIANPSEAVVLHEDSVKKQRRFGLGSRSKSFKDNASSSSSSALGDNVKKNKVPSTPTSKDTMRPIWKDDHVYFALQTHTEHGRPIDFTGSQLHISLVDTKTSSSVIGSYCLNLAHLVIRSRETATKLLDRSASHQHFGREGSPSLAQQNRLDRMGSKKRLGTTDRPGSQRRLLNNERQSGSQRRLLNNERPGSQRRLLNNERPGSQRRLMSSSTNEKGKRGGPKQPSSSAPGGNYQLVHKPSPAMRAAAANSAALKFGSSITELNTLPPAVKKAAQSIHRTASGASKLYDSIMADLGGIGSSLSSSQTKNKNDSEGFGLRSLRLQETLIEGGLITGMIKCDIDVWWT